MIISPQYVDGLELRVSELKAQVQALQARIDQLMLEHCPGEMTTEQLKRWSEAQRSVAEPCTCLGWCAYNPGQHHVNCTCRSSNHVTRSLAGGVSVDAVINAIGRKHNEYLVEGQVVPPLRVRFSRQGWMQLLLDPKVREGMQLVPGLAIESSLDNFFGARVMIDHRAGQEFAVEEDAE